MLRNAKTLERHELLARDGTIGHVKDLYFDDQQWNVRYFVVDAGSWLLSRQVLISPLSVDLPDWEKKILPVSLTKEQVKNSPGIDTDKPVSRQHEATLSDYYGWPYYWSDPVFTALAFAGPMGAMPSAGAVAADAERVLALDQAAAGVVGHGEYDPHLRNVNALIGHHIEALDGEIGHVEDVLIEDRTWEIRYLVISTGNWLPGKKVVIAPLWISDFNRNGSMIHIDLSRDAIKGSPAYDPQQPVDSGYSGRLHDHYGRPRYDRW
ncbi:photosystem reaction center subunit H [Nibricoccus aquaticus]|uniref:Photosystem reaction center subunit H n=1 Tax=Nibricoccus aquaticus TaxID=2576891 RepID=A0A290QGE4_9BACT|nr:PRC-barrel domain-containing protein [Nibricoccus aquaticus]ATC62952.1 photosystem reaction center subunit H [Nibricoccus aquaticus]